jgi:PPOX class probable F420-dependent enzyme
MSEVHSPGEKKLQQSEGREMVVQSYMFTDLVREKYISLTTFRKTGEAVITPMWFAESFGIIYVETGTITGKLKRIRRTARVTLAPCTLSGKVKGSVIEGKAQILTESQEIITAKAAMSKKYGLVRCLYYFLLDTILTILGKNKIDLVYIAIEPVSG